MPQGAEAQQRSGFIIGLGIGGGYNSNMLEGGGESETEGEIGLATDFKIGGMINPTTALYYVNMANFYSFVDETWVSSVGGLGATFFMDDSAPVAYIDATVGLGALTCLDEFCDDTETGFGAGVGTGVQLSGTTYLDFDVMYSRPISEDGGSWSILTFKGTFNWLSN